MSHNSLPLQLVRERAWNGPWAELPQHVADYPSMLSPEERLMLIWLTEHYFSNRGIVCDLGSYIGGSTISLADGLRRAGHNGNILQAYDFYFVGKKAWELRMADQGPYPRDGNALPTIKRMMEAYLDLVTFNQGDFLQCPVPDAPIEICFVDISKTPALNDHIIKNYFTKLIPGHSIVVQQDYFFRSPPWDIATMDILGDYFEVLSFTDVNSAIFLNTKQIDEHAIEISSSKHFSKAVFLDRIRAASVHWPFAAQKAQLYLALLEVEMAEGVIESATDIKAEMHGYTAEDVYKALDFS